VDADRHEPNEPTPPPGRSRPWDPATAAAERADLVVVEDPVAALFGGGFLVRRDGRHAIVLEPDLHPWQRRAALAHELVHVERGILDLRCAPEGWEHEVVREERAVRREVAARLAPPSVVRVVVDRLGRAGEAVTAAAVAVELEIPLDVAEEALAVLCDRSSARPAGTRCPTAPEDRPGL
jgi:hypothetical protein